MQCNHQCVICVIVLNHLGTLSEIISGDECKRFVTQDQDGQISYDEFQTMINPPKPPEPPKPTMADLTGLRQQKQVMILIGKQNEDACCCFTFEDGHHYHWQDPPATLSVTTMLATSPAQFSTNNGANTYANNGANSYANNGANTYANGGANSYANGGANGSSYVNGAATNSNQWSTERQVTAT